MFDDRISGHQPIFEQHIVVCVSVCLYDCMCSLEHDCHDDFTLFSHFFLFIISSLKSLLYIEVLKSLLFFFRVPFLKKNNSKGVGKFWIGFPKPYFCGKTSVTKLFFIYHIQY
jgi:hypothetical protein